MHLHTLIGESLSTIEEVYCKANANYPSLDDVDTPAFSERLLFNSDVVNASLVIVSAAEQLIASIKHPQISLWDTLMAYQLPTALAYAERFNLVEVLNKAGPSGIHLHELAEITQSSEARLVNIPILNRSSNIKYRGTDGKAAFVAIAGDEMFKAAAFLAQAYIDSPSSRSTSASESAFSHAVGSAGTSYFDWLNEPANAQYLDRFQHAILGVSGIEHPDALYEAYPWASLAQDSFVVDVGGGLGSITLKLVNSFPHLCYLIQDLPFVVSAAANYWLQANPDAWKSKRVQASSHNFFDTQPVKNAAVFLVRAVCHDHPDAVVIQILSLLRAAAQSYTILIIGDHIMPYACSDDTSAAEIVGAQSRLVPSPLLANAGKASSAAFYMDMTMQAMFNARERTLDSQIELLKASGWSVDRVSLNAFSRFGYIIAVPAY
ncbi:hypothetical protein D9757_006615 [Collybiopsis confluens]|uniref:O-methyltransferase C-terminal domain-containing protein n=1 Tax=Collybiopsis confluens TaxID=2823264 RepID=A0A8H5HQW1_9AGAR|nr:hypothetical protein D9757_006615 [Collybiopsis confluens]